MYTKRLEASVTHDILVQLANLGWIVDEKDPRCNVYQQRVKLTKQKELLNGKIPDFVLYKEGSNEPIIIIEAKKPNESIQLAMHQALNLYAKPLNTPLIFAYNGSYIETQYLYNGRNLKIDGEDVRQFINHHTALRFVNEGSEILSAVNFIQHSRDELIRIFKSAANLLREDGLQAGLDRFGAFSDILFLKILDEISVLKMLGGEENKLDEYLRWSSFSQKKGNELYQYVKDVVWIKINKKYGDIFSEAFPINSPDIFEEIICELSKLNLTASDSDVNGDAFEYFLKNAYQGIKIKDLGEYFTPRNIVRTMISMVNPKIGETIYDPFCGTGGFLIEAFRYLKIRTSFNDEMQNILRKKTIYGSEITVNARIAKMNMILFGDGHSNIKKQDTLSDYVNQKYDIVITNPPYSQQTRFGYLYPIQSNNGDAICPLHCFEALKLGGRGCLLVKENFVSDGGNVGKVREYIFNNSSNVSIVSLPRKLFEPYTPTKTSIIYFEKNRKISDTFFFAINAVGHELGSRKKPIKDNDLPVALDAFNNKKAVAEIESAIIPSTEIAKNSYSLWIYDYLDIFANLKGDIIKLGDYIEEITEKIEPSLQPITDFRILGVSNSIGIFDNEILKGEDINQKYKHVQAGDLVYNPHRINVGSLGLVSEELNGGYVSGIYIVFRVLKKFQDTLPSEYLLHVLKSKYYLAIIGKYDTKYGAVRANLTYEQLCNIHIPLLKKNEMKEFLEKISTLNNITEEFQKIKNNLKESIYEILPHL
ncbi:N-6 DNA methylase [Rickettsia endosymbiont of Culicoides newsteadi]|uniref:N-6 DNA methylase n=1 Tax=Rickettsia endosymbiont of Culicoides newsteadi TaxID=1961830 RepID=UPI000BCF4051|nr:N-6 DNA methylase [Rickettsia endosymbiont of Culicoides newsteadi]OZG31688.1 restriction endonuclease subunit M [Rickettsia endosymbiont of Culicoides newsteadi]